MLQYPQRKRASGGHQVVHVGTDPLALNLRVFQSRKGEACAPPLEQQLKDFSVELGKPNSISFRVWTGRNAVQSLELRISAPSATFQYKEASLDDGKLSSVKTLWRLEVTYIR